MVPLKVARLPRHPLIFGILMLLACVLASTRPEAQGDDLINAAGKGDLPRVKALLTANADVVNAKASNGATALIVASEEGHPEIVRALLDAKGDVTASPKALKTMVSTWMEFLAATACCGEEFVALTAGRAYDAHDGGQIGNSCS
jgi:hypothetical protein